jgi:hypothetical protein
MTQTDQAYFPHAINGPTATYWVAVFVIKCTSVALVGQADKPMGCGYRC